MKTEHTTSDDILNSVVLSQDDDNWTLSFEGKIYRIGKVLYQVIKQYQNSGVNNVDDIIAKQYGSKEIKESLDKLIIVLNNQSQQDHKRSSYIYFQIRLLNDAQVEFLARMLKFLFNRYCLLLCFFSALFLSLNYYKSNPVFIQVKDLTAVELVYAYFLVVVILMFHEIGHATASYNFGVRPKEIGFGFYLIFPVLFANVTSIWSINKNKRVMVNAAGIYFQLLVNAVLIVLYQYTSLNSNVIHFTIKINTYVAVYSLFPFFRNDGYWIYSDFFNIPNLVKQSYNYPKRIFYRLRDYSRTDTKTRGWQYEVPLALYSLSNYVFIAFFLFTYCKYLSQTVHDTYTLFTGSHLSFISLQQNADDIFRMAFMYIISAVFIYKNRGAVKSLYRTTRKT